MSDLKLDRETKEAIFFPPEVKEKIDEIVFRENWKAAWRFVDMLVKNYKVINTTNETKKSRK